MLQGLVVKSPEKAKKEIRDMGSQLEGDKELLIEMDGKLQVSRQIRASVAFLQPFVHLRMREDTPIMGHAKHSDFSRTHTVNPSPWQRKHH